MIGSIDGAALFPGALKKDFRLSTLSAGSSEKSLMMKERATDSPLLWCIVR